MRYNAPMTKRQPPKIVRSRVTPAQALFGGIAILGLLGYRFFQWTLPSLYTSTLVSFGATQEYGQIASLFVARPVRVPILLYHYVEIVADPRDTLRKNLGIVPSLLTAQITTLLAHGYTPIFMKDLARYFQGKSTLPDRPIVLTFDDGYRDFYTVVYPILVKNHVKATAYVVPGFLDTPNYMTKRQVVDVAMSGLVEVAAHTVHHINLKGLNHQAQVAEILSSKSDLEQLIGVPVVDFAYPYGSYDQQAVDVVASGGFSTAVTTKQGEVHTFGSRYELPRIRPGVRTGEALISWIESVQ